MVHINWKQPLRSKKIFLDFPDFIQKYIKRIEHSNETQGKNGQFFGHGTRDIATVRAVLLEDGPRREEDPSVCQDAGQGDGADGYAHEADEPQATEKILETIRKTAFRTL